MSEDHEAIRLLSYEYTFLLDEGRFDDLGALLRHATLTLVWGGQDAGSFTGEKDIAAFYRREVSTYSEGGRLVPPERQGNPRTRHVVTNHAIYVDGDRATAKSYFNVQQAPPRLPYYTAVAGRYDDAFEKVGGVWRFTAKTVRGDYLNDMSHHGRRHQEWFVE